MNIYGLSTILALMGDENMQFPGIFMGEPLIF